MTRIAIVDPNKCKPDKCSKECIKKCPPQKTGKQVIEIEDVGAELYTKSKNIDAYKNLTNKKK